jgi:pyridoxal phosphate enzyme (YggS family)
MIIENVKKILHEIPQDVIIIAAVKGRTVEEVQEAIDGGIRFLGENYLQEAEKKFQHIGTSVKWHFIGRIQRRKCKRIAEIFDMVETLDSLEIAMELNSALKVVNKIMPALIEVNSGREPQKSGLMTENVLPFVKEVSEFNNLKIKGLMTMGPFLGEPEKLRPYYIATRKIFEEVKSKNFSNVEMKYLSMGMSSSYKIAIEEGANIIRIGTLIFGSRK